jgi:hypothetical protein
MLSTSGGVGAGAGLVVGGRDGADAGPVVDEDPPPQPESIIIVSIAMAIHALRVFIFSQFKM